MTGAWIILAVTLAIGVMLWGWEKYRSHRHGHTMHHHAPQPTPYTVNAHPATDTPQRTEEPTVCCGLHAICEKTGQINEPPEYYDDEELDRFAGRAPGDYTEEETEEFRDVLLTLLPSDAPGWSISLEKRRISLPDVLLPELELMLSEANS